MKLTKECPHCGAENDPECIRCLYCGTDLPKTAQPKTDNEEASEIPSSKLPDTDLGLIIQELREQNRHLKTIALFCKIIMVSWAVSVICLLIYFLLIS